MTNSKVTQGSIKRAVGEDTRQLEKEQKKLEKQSKIIQAKMNADNKVIYKQSVTKAYVTEFANNYGDSFDYKSLLNSIKFNFKEDKNGDLLPSFTFSENDVDFKTNVEEEGRPFNENSYKEFITNEDQINGVQIYRQVADNLTELDGYQNNNIDSPETTKITGGFIPVSDNYERYDGFNKINRQIGFTSREESSKQATTKALKIWNESKKYSNKNKGE